MAVLLRWNRRWFNCRSIAEEWERDASLRLRAGDKTALDAYAEHGRIVGGSREQALDQARQGYLARRLAGEDASLMAHSREDCRELSRLIRDDLILLTITEFPT